MSRERNLNFYIIPRSVLVAEEMGDFDLMLKENIPAFIGIPTDEKDLILQMMLDNNEMRRQRAEAFISSMYRLPDDILETEIVDLSERQRITSVIKQVDSISLGLLNSRDHTNETYKALKDIFLIRDHPTRDASWVRIPITGRVDGEINKASHRIEGFTAYLDAERIPDDYIGKGSDEFFLNRDSSGDLKSYSVKYKGEDHPMTPWEYMHTADLPIIQQFIGRVEEDIRNLPSGVTRTNLV